MLPFAPLKTSKYSIQLMLANSQRGLLAFFFIYVLIDVLADFPALAPTVALLCIVPPQPLTLPGSGPSLGSIPVTFAVRSPACTYAAAASAKRRGSLDWSSRSPLTRPHVPALLHHSSRGLFNLKSLATRRIHMPRVVNVTSAETTEMWEGG